MKRDILSKKAVLETLDLMINTNGITVAAVHILDEDNGKKFLKSIKHYLTSHTPTTPINPNGEVRRDER